MHFTQTNTYTADTLRSSSNFRETRRFAFDHIATPPFTTQVTLFEALPHTMSRARFSTSPADPTTKLRRQSNLSTLSLSPRPPTTSSTATTRPRRTPGYQQDESSYIEEEPYTLVDRLRNWRNDAMTQHLYGTAEFWGSKVFGLTGVLHRTK